MRKNLRNLTAGEARRQAEEERPRREQADREDAWLFQRQMERDDQPKGIVINARMLAVVAALAFVFVIIAIIVGWYWLALAGGLIGVMFALWAGLWWGLEYLSSHTLPPWGTAGTKRR